jgi:hypothetical protein
MDRSRLGQYGAALAIILAVFLLLFFLVYADRSRQGHDGGPLTEQTTP